MGMHQSTYVGPYLKVPGIQGSKQINSFTCSPGCPQKNSVTPSFCSRCGHPVLKAVQNIQAMCEFNLDDLDPKFEEQLSRCLTERKHLKAVSFWIANTIRIGATFTEYDESKEYELDPLSVQSQCNQFAMHYAAIIQAIKDTYDIEPKVCFGVISEMR